MPKNARSAALLERVRKLCAALPGATEKKAWSAPTFRVSERMFAMFDDGHHGADRVALWCNVPLDVQRAAVAGDPENFFVPPYVGAKGWVGVRLDRTLPWKNVAGMLQLAYDGTVKRKAAR